MRSLVDCVIEVLDPIHNGEESVSATARKVIDAVLNHGPSETEEVRRMASAGEPLVGPRGRRETMQLKNVQHDFETPVGETGVTIRKGFKWALVPASTQLELWRCERPHTGICPIADGDYSGPCAQQGTGRVVGHWVGQLKDLPARIIEQEHEEKSRAYSGLLFSLKRAYGQVSDGDYVTALFYVRRA